MLNGRPVRDADLVGAMRLVYERVKIVIEPTAALGLAGLLRRGTSEGSRVGVVISGGNVEPSVFADLMRG